MTQAPMTAPATVQNFHGKWYYLGTGASGSSEWIGPFDTEAAAEAGQDARVQRAAEDIHAQGATALAAKYAHAFGGSARVTGLRGVNQGETRARGLSVFLWGPSGSWKTTFCCGMPRPFIISVGAEGGDATLDEFPRLAKHFNERSRITDAPPYLNWERPPSVQVKTRQDMEDVIQQVVKNYRTWGVATVVVDSVTFLLDMWLAEYLGWKYRTNPKYKDLIDSTRGGLVTDVSDFGPLNNWLRGIWVPLNSAGLNVVFTALEQEVRKSVNQTESKITAIKPMLQGGGGNIKLPAACSMHLHTRLEQVIESQMVSSRPVYYTAPYRSEVVFCRHRFFDKFPKGRLEDPEWPSLPTPRALWWTLREQIYLGA